jgi:hypothetical protein
MNEEQMEVSKGDRLYFEHNQLKDNEDFDRLWKSIFPVSWIEN